MIKGSERINAPRKLRSLTLLLLFVTSISSVPASAREDGVQSGEVPSLGIVERAKGCLPSWLTDPPAWVKSSCKWAGRCFVVLDILVFKECAEQYQGCLNHAEYQLVSCLESDPLRHNPSCPQPGDKYYHCRQSWRTCQQHCDTQDRGKWAQQDLGEFDEETVTPFYLQCIENCNTTFSSCKDLIDENGEIPLPPHCNDDSFNHAEYCNKIYALEIATCATQYVVCNTPGELFVESPDYCEWS